MFTQAKLSRRFTRWLDFLADYDFDIAYQPGEKNLTADALSRRPDVAAPAVTVSSLSLSLPELDPALRKSLIAAHAKDPTFSVIVHCLQHHQPLPPHYRQSQYVLTPSGLLVLQEDAHVSRVCVPNDAKIRAQLLEELNDVPTAGHFGFLKTYQQAQKFFYWPRMDKFIKN